MKRDKKHTKLWLLLIGCLIIVVAAAWFLMVRLEGEAPKVEIDLLTPSLGRSQEMSVSVSDADSGLRQLWVGLLKDGKEIVLHDETFPSAGLFKGGTANDASVKIPIAPIDLGFTDGEAILRLVVRDYSWRNWWKGNQTYAEKPVVIDTRAPGIEVFTNAHNINQGGAGLVIYRTSETCSQSGVQVGQKFFPGYTGHFKDPNVYLAFFALGYDQGRDTAIHLTAVDQAGNRGKSGLNYHIRRKKFRKDLYFRLGVINVKAPSLNERPDDVVPLTKYFLQEFSQKFGKKFKGISSEAEAVLLAHNWTGHVRELKNLVERAVLIGKGPDLLPVDLGIESQPQDEHMAHVSDKDGFPPFYS